MKNRMDRRGDAVTRRQRHTGRKANNDREDEGLGKNTRLQRRWAGRQKDTKAAGRETVREQGSQGGRTQKAQVSGKQRRGRRAPRPNQEQRQATAE